MQREQERRRNRNTSRNGSHLEQLPVEIVLQILSDLHPEELKPIIHASPRFHEVYRAYRKRILFTCLENALSGAMLDAFSVYITSSVEYLQRRDRENARHFLKTYKKHLRPGCFSIHRMKLKEADALDIWTYYFTLLPITRRFRDWALTDLFKQTNSEQSREALRKIEWLRVRRALYRFQLCCNLFSRVMLGRLKHRTYSLADPNDLEMSHLFFSMFPPWEIEEMFCVYDFVKDSYDEIFHAVEEDLHPRSHPDYHFEYPPTPPGCITFDGPSWDWYREGTTARGLVLLAKVFRCEAQSDLVSLMREDIVSCGSGFIDEWVGSEHAQLTRRRRQLSKRDMMQKEQKPMEFNGDAANRPPLAWTILWWGTYSNLYGEYIPREIRRWGYVFWDAARFQTSGVEEVLDRQRRWGWSADDPREHWWNWT